MEKNSLILAIMLFLEFVLSYYIISFLIRFLKEKNAVQHVRDELIESHKKKEGTPRGGGLVFLLAPLFVLPLYHTRDVLFFVVSVFLFGLIGFVDDFLTFRRGSSEGLSIRNKLMLYSIVSFVLFFLFKDQFTNKLEFFGLTFTVSPILYFILFMSIMVGSTNAFNLTDGVDGLLGSVSSIMLVFFAILSNQLNLSAVFVITLFLIIPILSFLWFNSPKASIFMGDLGASVLGSAIASISILTKMELYLPFIAIIPVIEAISIFIQIAYFKATHGKRVFRMAPIHHHFEILGWSEAKVDFRFSIITALFCIAILIFKVLH